MGDPSLYHIKLYTLVLRASENKRTTTTKSEKKRKIAVCSQSHRINRNFYLKSSNHYNLKSKLNLLSNYLIIIISNEIIK